MSDAQDDAKSDASPEAPASRRWPPRVRAWLFAPEDAGALAIYRILWGFLMAWESYRYLRAGWVHSYYVAPNFLFSYIGFEWLPALPGWGMPAVFVVMIVSGITVGLGLCYRLSSVVFFATHLYSFLLAASNYLNHAYLIALLSLIMVFLPAHRTLSFDALIWKRRASTTIARWPRAFLLAQLACVYVFGGIAKFNTDWIVYQQPVRQWMKGSAKNVPAFAKAFVASEPCTQFVAYGGIFFDLFIAPALLWRRTRPLAVLVAAGFHISNMHLFSIGVFPWLMLAATTLFLEPDWARRLPWLGRFVGAGMDWMARAAEPQEVSAKRRRVILWVLGVWMAIQIVVPLRHHAYPGNVAWNEDGHYCAWRMKLRSKRGSIKYRVVDRKTGRKWKVDPKDDLSKRQARKLRGKPELIRQYAHHLVERYRLEDGLDVDVYADAYVGLNYRPSKRFIDPKHELGHEPASLGPYRWVLPFVWSVPPHPGDKK